MTAFYRPLMTGVSNNNKKADILDAASLFKADQAYHNYHFLKCQLKKESHKSPSRITRLFRATSEDTVSVFLSSLVCRPARAGPDVGHAMETPLFFTSWQSLRFISHRTQGRVTIFPCLGELLSGLTPSW